MKPAPFVSCLLRFRHLVLIVSGLGTVLLSAAYCLGQQLIEGSHGARMIQWPINGQITSMALTEDGSVVVGGFTAIDLGGGEVGFAPRLWHVEQSGSVQPVSLPTLSTTSSNVSGWVNGLSRDGRWAGGWTPLADTTAGTLWDVNDPSMAGEIGLTIAMDGNTQMAVGSEVVAIGDDATSFGDARVGEDGIARAYGFVQRFGEEQATMLPSLPQESGAIGNLRPWGVSEDGKVVVGQIQFEDALFRAAYWRSGETFPQRLFDDDSASRALAISPNGRYAGGQVAHGNSPNPLYRGFVRDLHHEESTFIVDQFGFPWFAPVTDVTNDGRIAVGDANVLSDYQHYAPDTGFIAIDGLAHTFTDWLAERFALGGLSFEIVPAVYRQGERYHFIAQSGNNETWAGTVHYISIPVRSIVAPLLAGDYNDEGTVDAADYVVWRNNDGAPAGYETWRANFGRTAGSTSFSGATIPEPDSGLLGAVVLMIYSCTRATPSSSPHGLPRQRLTGRRAILVGLQGTASPRSCDACRPRRFVFS